jgi:predicted transport protein
MRRWTCPACGRTFGRNLQGHVCVPVRTLADFLAAQPAELRSVFEAVVEHVSQLEDIVIEPGDVYLMLKRSRTFATLTPRRRWVRMWFSLPYAIDDDRIQSRTREAGRGVGHYAQLGTADDVDETIRNWLTEAYEAF